MFLICTFMQVNCDYTHKTSHFCDFFFLLNRKWHQSQKRLQQQPKKPEVQNLPGARLQTAASPEPRWRRWAQHGATRLLLRGAAPHRCCVSGVVASLPLRDRRQQRSRGGLEPLSAFSRAAAHPCTLHPADLGPRPPQGPDLSVPSRLTLSHHRSSVRQLSEFNPKAKKPETLPPFYEVKAPQGLACFWKRARR